MQYDLSNELDRERFKARTNALYKKGVVVELTEKTFRSLSQNSYIHLLIGLVAIEIGISLETCKVDYFKRLVNPDIFIIKKHSEQLGDVEEIRSSASLNKEEMSMAIDRFKRWGMEQGFRMPSPEDESLLHQLEIEIGRYRQFM